MEISSEEKKEMAQPSVVSSAPKYPYGLKIHFDEDSFSKLGIEPPKVGTKFMVLAIAEVCDVHQEKYDGDVPRVSVGMQITDIDLKSKEKEESEDIAGKLYGGE
jgi:hypothetical protein